MSLPAKHPERERLWLAVLTGAGLLLGLYFASRHSYLLFHSLAEIFSIVVACTVFVVFWNARSWMGNTCYLFIGIAFLFVAFIDLLHTLSIGTMNVFPGYTTNLGVQLWVLARYLESLSLIAALLFLHRAHRSHIAHRGVRRGGGRGSEHGLLLEGVSQTATTRR